MVLSDNARLLHKVRCSQADGMLWQSRTILAGGICVPKDLLIHSPGIVVPECNSGRDAGQHTMKDCVSNTGM